MCFENSVGSYWNENLHPTRFPTVTTIYFIGPSGTEFLNYDHVSTERSNGEAAWCRTHNLPVSCAAQCNTQSECSASLFERGKNDCIQGRSDWLVIYYCKTLISSVIKTSAISESVTGDHGISSI